jgi:hypothetical protein
VTTTSHCLFSSSLCLRRRGWQQFVIIFFYGYFIAKKVMTVMIIVIFFFFFLCLRRRRSRQYVVLFCGCFIVKEAMSFSLLSAWEEKNNDHSYFLVLLLRRMFHKNWQLTMMSWFLKMFRVVITRGRKPKKVGGDLEA